jgi:hypothetical protein
MECPTCHTPTEPSSAGHPTLCYDCTQRELSETLAHPRTRRPDPLGRQTWARGLHAHTRANKPRNGGIA